MVYFGISLPQRCPALTYATARRCEPASSRPSRAACQHAAEARNLRPGPFAGESILSLLKGRRGDRRIPPRLPCDSTVIPTQHRGPQYAPILRVLGW
jgi:hypothetical protein